MSKRNVSFAKPSEAPFIKRLKEKIGYKEGPTVDTKKEQLPIDNEENDEIDEEKPVVVVLKPGDLSEEQFKEYQRAESTKDEKMVFRKPVKRPGSEGNHLVCSTKKAKDEELKTVTVDKSKQVKNRSLLSFDDEEDND